jgi:DNA-binding transcriptional ArsR family regulator
MKTAVGHDNRTQDIIACLAVPSRFRLVRAIAEEERCVGELAISVGLSQSCTTRHLQALERVGLVRGEREGRRVRFALRSDLAGAGDLLRLVLGYEPEQTEAEPGESSAARSRRDVEPPASTANGSNSSALVSNDSTPPAEETHGPEAQGHPMVSRRRDIEDYLL